MILGIGTDLTEIARIQKTGLERLAGRILSREERSELPEGGFRRAEWLAGRFAAKEAVAKAAGTGIGSVIGFREIMIRNDEKGKPHARIDPAALERLGWDESVMVHLSVTHTREYAAAFAVLERR
ncbi:holo-[acyl-carrier-protein] synthase [Melghirimyces profundicolus]|uniref:Holo-[acyl-carrier-protein] synthase n=1 Tax=Melghirimyces profundicolus TaxID=1242148 RepID=A0A2T6BS42_9BACL|nr:holo-ACP synthase [Melghirimyces profundicolus]PTX58891.1 holo-[acyl-carrier-protein] synthase [Melghirimyces profundicolus]